MSPWCSQIIQENRGRGFPRCRGPAMLSAEPSLNWGGSRLCVGTPHPVAWWIPEGSRASTGASAGWGLPAVSFSSLPSLGLSLLTYEMGRMAVPTSDIRESPVCGGLGKGRTGPERGFKKELLGNKPRLELEPRAQLVCGAQGEGVAENLLVTCTPSQL